MGMLLRRNKSLYEKSPATPKGAEKPPVAPVGTKKPKRKAAPKKKPEQKVSAVVPQENVVEPEKGVEPEGKKDGLQNP